MKDIILTHNRSPHTPARTIPPEKAPPAVRRSKLGLRAAVAWSMAIAATATISPAAGTLTAKDSGHQAIEIVDHVLDVTINNGFARTTVTQSFHNPNDIELEALYRFPLPESASLSEVSLFLGEERIDGEVLAKERARTIYQQQKAAGKAAALADKNSYRWFEFRVHPVPPGQQTRLRMVYYQPLKIDTGIGRYVYPLEEGGTDGGAANDFWAGTNDAVTGSFSANFELKSAWPVENVRLPGHEGSTKTEKLAEGHYKVRLDSVGQALNRDLVFYYRLADDLPGRVELLTHRESIDQPGTFMMVVTPGVDLQPIKSGADYVYVLDTSGSMKDKLNTLSEGMIKVLGKMNANDRFRVITFNNRAADLSRGWQAATDENVAEMIGKIRTLRSDGGTNVYQGLQMALEDLDDDRAASVVLVTDGVTNRGIVNPKAFHDLMKSNDVRVFGFLLGNSGNWPLLQTICDASGGFYAGVSNADDIIGQIMQAKSKILHECMHDVSLKIDGVGATEYGDQLLGKVYRGEQVVVFGRYDQAGEAELELSARMTGEDTVYRTRFAFPEVDTKNPEIERLWALDQIERAGARRDIGGLSARHASERVRELGLSYQLVTDETSMVVLSDEAFAEQGIERRNQQRVARERAAQSVRHQQPVASNRVDAQQPLTPSRSASHQRPSGKRSSGGGIGGGGAFDPITVAGVVLMILVAALSFRRKESEQA